MYLTFTMPLISIPLIPIEIRWYNILDSARPEASNWTELDIAYVSGRKDGIAVRETAIKVAFKSDHAIEMFGEDNPADSIEINGVTYYGKTVPGVDKDTPHVLTALQVGMRAVHLKQLQEARNQAKVITLSDPPSDEPGAEPAAA